MDVLRPAPQHTYENGCSCRNASTGRLRLDLPARPSPQCRYGTCVVVTPDYNPRLRPKTRPMHYIGDRQSSWKLLADFDADAVNLCPLAGPPPHQRCRPL